MKTSYKKGDTIRVIKNEEPSDKLYTSYIGKLGIVVRDSSARQCSTLSILLLHIDKVQLFYFTEIVPCKLSYNKLKLI